VETAFGPIAGTNGTVNNPTASAKFDVGSPPNGNENEGPCRNIDDNTRWPNGNEEPRRNNKPPAKKPRPIRPRRNVARGHAAKIFSKIFATGPVATNLAELPPAPRRNIVVIHADWPSAG
jgi:hypothetical protein